MGGPWSQPFFAAWSLPIQISVFSVSGVANQPKMSQLTHNVRTTKLTHHFVSLALTKIDKQIISIRFVRPLHTPLIGRWGDTLVHALETHPQHTNSCFMKLLKVHFRNHLMKSLNNIQKHSQQFRVCNPLFLPFWYIFKAFLLTFS